VNFTLGKGLPEATDCRNPQIIMIAIKASFMSGNKNTVTEGTVNRLELRNRLKGSIYLYLAKLGICNPGKRKDSYMVEYAQNNMTRRPKTIVFRF
jgi:hypothetical protein